MHKVAVISQDQIAAIIVVINDLRSMGVLMHYKALDTVNRVDFEAKKRKLATKPQENHEILHAINQVEKVIAFMKEFQTNGKPYMEFTQVEEIGEFHR